MTRSNVQLGGQELKLDADADTSITADTDDQVDFKIGGTDRVSIASTGATTITTGDFDSAESSLTLVSTDTDADVGPTLDLYRNSASPADDDLIGMIIFHGEDDAGNKQEYAKIRAQAKDVTHGSEDTQLAIQTQVGGAGRERIKLTPTETAINDDGVDLDFRVESDSQSHMLFVDASTDSVLFGMSSATSGGFGSGTKFAMNSSGGSCLGLRVTENSATSINMVDFRDGDDQRMGEIVCNASANTTSYGTSSDRSKKQNDRPIPNATERVSALNPVLFDWISDGTSSEGFIAQELEKDTQIGIDAVNGEDGEKTLDYGRLTPLLTAALKEAISEIKTLKEKVAALESK